MRAAARSIAKLAQRRFLRPSLSTSRAFSSLYTEDHEYLKKDGDNYFMGISDHAQAELGDVVFVELPDVGAEFEKGEAIGSVESVKAASSVYAPVDMEIVEVNETVVEDNSLVNEDAEGAGWMVKVIVKNEEQLEGLLDEAAYKNII
mmetsp:Transcript_22378/g.33338  ORF Transcript_22378/g.33338 Transcript_22378/m.33338 type:complete len:147 (+) Transcript_22378:55-495(+)|eukprot:CAMPEP_0167758130 /NCGR_PEP_ID=MMETSP0110_2-20121227/10300_1 /TAXON_ID=629695 /ORGANISM="Gymnochlora sp., Strain CCMP2014" /LENGTH=146 /DNA_ID=CAMNT_0007644377 /DNA_START=44 /DNA_END=484 /DNA_ORIENTATION=+